jgi:SAM-dependent methyltransferase/N-acetylglutamate synthase-like GNAT family acetyltransferase
MYRAESLWVKEDAAMPTKAATIEPASDADLAAVKSLLDARGLPIEGLDEHVGAALVAREGGEVVGAVALELYGDAALLRSLVVRSDRQRIGLGTGLTEAALALARQRGVRELYLLTETADGFFPRFGFERVARDQVAPAVRGSVEFASACPQSARAMRLPLANPDVIHEAVRSAYAARARQFIELGPAPSRTSCCGPSCCGTSCCTTSSCCADGTGVVSGGLYSAEDAAELPSAAVQASLGCGNPTALVELRPGEVVLDLGSGGGIDVLLSARRVGPTGRAYGVDMTDEMLALARQNAAEAGATNVEFLKGRIETVPLPDASVDVVISNCVINLSPDKGEVLREAHRVLKPGGRFAVSDVVIDGPVPADLRRRVELWVGCIAGALERSEYERKLRAAGFSEVEIVPTRYYRAEDLGDSALAAWLAEQPAAERERLSRAFMSAFVRATKPAG